jgi:hypothetical protein
MSDYLSVPQSVFDADRNKKLKRAQECAELGFEGHTYFYEFSRRPLISMFLTTGALKENSETEHDVHLRYVQQHEKYPSVPKDFEGIVKKGYKMYDKYRKSREKRVYKFDFYNTKFREMCKLIEDSIADKHGIACHEDGNLENNHESNVYYMHICDIMNIMIKKRCNNVPKIVIKTSSLQEIKEETVNVFSSTVLDADQENFLVENIDIFYLVYAFYGNNSQIAIRTKVSPNSKMFQESSFFMNDSHFVMHQRGKMQEYNQYFMRVESQLAYRTI